MKTGMYGHLRPGTRVDLITSLLKERLFEEMFILSRADRQNGHTETAEKDMKAILSVKLPDEFRNLGENSAMKIRELRCLAVAENIYTDRQADNS
jgi:tRNA nucleotidyltransferase (CCA-adding enzyme)